jgi:hypothetical protein
MVFLVTFLLHRTTTARCFCHHAAVLCWVYICSSLPPIHSSTFVHRLSHHLLNRQLYIAHSFCRSRNIPPHSPIDKIVHRSFPLYIPGPAILTHSFCTSTCASSGSKLLLNDFQGIEASSEHVQDVMIIIILLSFS